MEPEITLRCAFTVVGMQIDTSAATLEADIARLWQKANDLNLDKQIRSRVDKNLSLAFIRNWSPDQVFTYFLGVEVDPVDHVPEGCVIQHIDAAEYAVFDLVSQDAGLLEPWPEIMRWLENSQVRWAQPMNFREYDEATQGGRIFLPIVRE